MSAREIMMAAALTATLMSVGAMPALAGEDQVPNDVQSFFENDGVEFFAAVTDDVAVAARGGTDEQMPDFSSVSAFGSIHAIHGWSVEFVMGQSGDATVALDEWIAAALNEDGSVAGTMTAFSRNGGAAELAHFDGDSRLGEALQGAPGDATLVSDPTTGAWYIVADGVVTALNEMAAIEAPTPTPIDRMQEIVAARVQADMEASDGLEGAAGSSLVVPTPWYVNQTLWTLAGGFVALILGGAAVLVWRRTHGRR